MSRASECVSSCPISTKLGDSLSLKGWKERATGAK